MSPFWLASALSTLSYAALQAAAFDISRSDNLAVYWGQNSYGATHLNDPANWQHKIGFYCQDDAIDTIPIAFLNVFSSTGGYPSINIANICNVDDSGAFPGTSLADCSFLASEIKYCQSRGKIVTLSLGGATGAANFNSAAQAAAFGDTIWNLFLGGTSDIRPFGDAVLDGIDLDIEGGSTVYFDSFVNRIREHAASADKRYYVTAAPQCPFPDAYLGTVLNAVAFDAVYVQFYNNWCGVQNYDNIWAWDYASWDTWAKASVNPNVKVYIGAPASSTAAGSGYVDATTLANIALETRSQYSSFGGIMLWDASQAYANNRYDVQIKNALVAGNTGSSSSSSSSSSATTTSRASTGTSMSTGASGPGSSTASSASVTTTSRATTATGGSTSSGASTTTTRASTTTTLTGTTTRASTTTTRASTTTTQASTTTTRASSTSTVSRSSTGTSAGASTSTRASTTTTRGSTTTTRASTTTTRASTTTTRASTTTTRASTTSTRAGTITTTARTSSTSSAAPTSTAGACRSDIAWRTGYAYVGGNQVSYNGHLWTAKWWSYNDVPGGVAGVWADNGPC
ncbi:glycoside hydrolase superfamily [Trametes polyzona]|nr:glycoside hydrolase superfamily [Trametes polyzona]